MPSTITPSMNINSWKQGSTVVCVFVCVSVCVCVCVSEVLRLGKVVLMAGWD